MKIKCLRRSVMNNDGQVLRRKIKIDRKLKISYVLVEGMIGILKTESLVVPMDSGVIYRNPTSRIDTYLTKNEFSELTREDLRL